MATMVSQSGKKIPELHVRLINVDLYIDKRSHTCSCKQKFISSSLELQPYYLGCFKKIIQ